VTGSGNYDFTLGINALGLDELVVTGVTNPKSKLESSASLTTLYTVKILQSAPRSTAEIFRAIS